MAKLRDRNRRRTSNRRRQKRAALKSGVYKELQAAVTKAKRHAYNLKGELRSLERFVLIILPSLLQ